MDAYSAVTTGSDVIGVNRAVHYRLLVVRGNLAGVPFAGVDVGRADDLQLPDSRHTGSFAMNGCVSTIASTLAARITDTPHAQMPTRENAAFVLE